MSAATAAILTDLDARGLIQDSTDRAALAARLDEGPISLYCGFDPTADSLHVGNLVGLLTLRRFQRFGHRPIALAGGATGLIGDPSGRSEERNLLTDEVLGGNLQQIVPQLRRFLDFDEGPSQARLHDNRSWTLSLSALDFLRDIGKHVTVNAMLAKESVRSRLAGETGISYTEFSYMLLQANDFLQLHRLEGCELQVGGSDQWGNIALGIDLIRRHSGERAHGLTWPLLTRPDGSKYGKTAAGEQIWLGAHRMSPYRFFQAWMQADDGEIRKLLAQLTLLEIDVVDEVAAEHASQPERRIGQRRLARELTALAHGDVAAATAEEASTVLFGSDPREAAETTLASIADEVPTVRISRDRLVAGIDAVELMVEAELAASKGEARRTVAQSGLTVNHAKAEVGAVVDGGSLLHGRFVLLRRGKSNYRLVVAE